jgi:hypothetical protein
VNLTPIPALQQVSAVELSTSSCANGSINVAVPAEDYVGITGITFLVFDQYHLDREGLTTAE